MAILILLLLGSVLISKPRSSDSSAIVSNTGIHWHPELEIFVDGNKIEIPENKGIERAPHSPIHTHNDLPIIHLEFNGVVREDDIRLGKFFKVWDKEFRGFGTNVVMTVNREENTEFENYVMRHEDKIVLRYSN